MRKVIESQASRLEETGFAAQTTPPEILQNVQDI